MLAISPLIKIGPEGNQENVNPSGFPTKVEVVDAIWVHQLSTQYHNNFSLNASDPQEPDVALSRAIGYLMSCSRALKHKGCGCLFELPPSLAKVVYVM